jgi:hypothetical protein
MLFFFLNLYFKSLIKILEFYKKTKKKNKDINSLINYFNNKQSY